MFSNFYFGIWVNLESFMFVFVVLFKKKHFGPFFYVVFKKINKIKAHLLYGKPFLNVPYFC